MMSLTKSEVKLLLTALEKYAEKSMNVHTTYF